jgi:type I restriction-modification system DNA methylase subunit
VLPGEVRYCRGSEGRRVLHADVNRPPHREIIEPFKGKILDPACGSGGMFVQSARFVEDHRNGAKGRLSIYGQERVDETLKLCK